VRPFRVALGVVSGEAEAWHYMLLYRVSPIYLNELNPLLELVLSGSSPDLYDLV